MAFCSKAVWNALIEVQSGAMVAVDMVGMFSDSELAGDGGLLDDRHDVVVRLVYDVCYCVV